MRTSAASCFVLLAALLGLSCNVNREVSDTDPDAKSSDPNQPMYRLTLTPPDAILSVDGKNPAMLGYHVLRDGQDVTEQATLSLDDGRLGSFEGSVLNVPVGAAGKTMVRAHVGDDEGVTSLMVRVTVVVIAPGANPDAPTKFGGADDPSRAPSLAYPPASALVPPNLGELEVQWVPNAAELFEVRFIGDAIDLRIYTPCNPIGSGCTLLPDESSWKWLSQAARGGTVQLTLRGTAMAGGGVGTSATQDLSFGNDDMKGGLYYWAASTGGIARYDFGLRGQKAESYYGPLQAVAICVGCHALSRNGQRIAVGMNTPGPAAMRALDTGMRSKLFEVGTLGIGVGSNYQAWTSDGKWLITTEKGGLTVRDGTSGTVSGNNPGLANANMPDISPDGKSVVFSRNVTPQCVLGFCDLIGAGSQPVYGSV